MQKKNKLMLVCAIGMAAVVVASSAVRCSVARTAEDGRGQGDGAAAQAAGSGEVEAPSAQGGKVGAGDPGFDIASVLQGNVWQAPDAPEKTISFRDGSFAESDGSSMRLSLFDVRGAGEADGQRYLDVDIVREDGDRASTTIIVEEEEGALSVASDGFALEKRYVQGKAADGPVAVEGLREPYVGLVDGKTGELASAVSSWCAAHAPSATASAFDGEVYLDIEGGRVSATFHLDDAASSIITVVYEGGAFSVLG